MNTWTRLGAIGLLSLSFVCADALAGDAPDPDVQRLVDDAAVVGETYAREGKRIARDAVDFAEDVADDFTGAYEQAKDRRD